MCGSYNASYKMHVDVPKPSQLQSPQAPTQPRRRAPKVGDAPAARYEDLLNRQHALNARSHLPTVLDQGGSALQDIYEKSNGCVGSFSGMSSVGL